jgi:hypothetical protein
MSYKEAIIIEQSELRGDQIAEQFALFWPDGTPVVPGGVSKEMDDIKSRLDLLETQVKEIKDKEPKR